jgi:hypothetical protein
MTSALRRVPTSGAASARTDTRTDCMLRTIVLVLTGEPLLRHLWLSDRHLPSKQEDAGKLPSWINDLRGSQVPDVPVASWVFAHECGTWMCFCRIIRHLRVGAVRRVRPRFASCRNGDGFYDACAEPGSKHPTERSLKRLFADATLHMYSRVKSWRGYDGTLGHPSSWSCWRWT